MKRTSLQERCLRFHRMVATDEDYKEARAELIKLKEILGSKHPDLVRAEWLMNFMEGKD